MLLRSRNKNTGNFDLIASAERTAAHTLALGRVAMAGIFVDQVVQNSPYQSWALAATAGAVTVADFIDGRLARHAAKRLDGDTTRFGKWLDQLTDKIFAHAAIISMGMSEIAQGNIGLHKPYGVYIIGMDSYILARDILVTSERYIADKKGIDVASKNRGKWKAAIGMATIGVAASPIATNTPVEVAVAGGMTAFMYTSIRSGFELHKSYKNSEFTNIAPTTPNIEILESDDPFN